MRLILMIVADTRRGASCDTQDRRRLELSMNFREVSQDPERALTRAFTIKYLSRHYTKIITDGVTKILKAVWRFWSLQVYQFASADPV